MVKRQINEILELPELAVSPIEMLKIMLSMESETDRRVYIRQQGVCFGERYLRYTSFPEHPYGDGYDDDISFNFYEPNRLGIEISFFIEDNKRRHHYGQISFSRKSDVIIHVLSETETFDQAMATLVGSIRQLVKKILSDYTESRNAGSFENTRTSYEETIKVMTNIVKGIERGIASN